MEQTLFRPPFVGPSSCKVSSVVPKNGCLDILGAAGGSAIPAPDTSDHHTRADYVQVID